MTENAAEYAGYGRPFDDDEKADSYSIRLKSFLETFESYVRIIGIKENGDIGSHKIQGRIQVRCLNSSDPDKAYRIVGLDVGQLPGCGCPDGITIEIEEYDD